MLSVGRKKPAFDECRLFLHENILYDIYMTIGHRGQWLSPVWQVFLQYDDLYRTSRQA